MSNLLVQNIKHTNGTTAQTIDSTGRILTPARPAFLAYNTTDNWINYAHGARRDLIWNATKFNIGSHFDTSTYKFTCPVAGIYYFHCWTYSGTNTNYIYLLLNDAEKQTSLNANDASETNHMTAIVQCSASDVVHTGYLGGSDVTTNVYSNNSEQWSGFEGYLIG